MYSFDKAYRRNYTHGSLFENKKAANVEMFNFDELGSYNKRDSLFEKSEYSEYANQAKEFMKEFSGEKFTQTDVMEAYEKFEPWCLNKNIYSAYEYKIDDDFMLDRDENAESSEERLESIVCI